MKAVSPAPSPSSSSVSSSPASASPSAPSADKAVAAPSSGALTTPSDVSAPSAPTSVGKDGAAAGSSAIGPSSSGPSSAPSFTPSVPGETGDSYVVAMQKKMDEQAEAIKALTATVEKLLAQQAAVTKAEEPALDLNAIVDGISEKEDPIIAAVLSGDVDKATELAQSKGGITKVVNEAVQKSLAAKPFFGAQRIYSPAASPEPK